MTLPPSHRQKQQVRLLTAINLHKTGIPTFGWLCYESCTDVSNTIAGLARLKEVLDQRAMEAEFRQKPHYEDASTNPANHKDKVRYASGLWLSRNHEMQQPQHRHPQQPQLQQSRHESSVSSFKQRSKRNSPEYSPWKRRKVHHESSSVVKKSELHHHSTTAHWPQAAASSSSQTASEAADPMMATLTAAGRDMAVNMMKKRKPGLAGRMYDVPQIGKLQAFLRYGVQNTSLQHCNTYHHHKIISSLQTFEDSVLIMPRPGFMSHGFSLTDVYNSHTTRLLSKLLFLRKIGITESDFNSHLRTSKKPLLLLLPRKYGCKI